MTFPADTSIIFLQKKLGERISEESKLNEIDLINSNKSPVILIEQVREILSSYTNGSLFFDVLFK